MPPVGYPANVPAPYFVNVIGCNTDQYSGLLCEDEGTLSTLNLEGDIAVLVLAERIDVGVSGFRTSGYPAVPAQVLTHDPGSDASSWWYRAMNHVGYGCRELACNFGNAHSAFRDIAGQNVSSVFIGPDLIPLPSDTDSTSGLDGPVGSEGDSGGGVFVRYDGSPGVPHQLLGVFNVSTEQDRYVRVTSGTIQHWLTTVLGERRPDTGTWGGAYIPVGTVNTSGTVASIFPSTGRVWAGESDLPPMTESRQRSQWAELHPCIGSRTCNDPDACALCGDPDTLDPDGDGLVLGHDNCWGIYNPAQRLTDDDPGRGFPAATALAPSIAGQASWCLVTGDPFHDHPQLHCLSRSIAAGAAEPSNDADHDSVPDECDDCTFHDPHQRLDCTGVPTACAPDSDNDGVPDACDACNSFSVSTRDCNFDAERVVPHDGGFVPDVCDPVECGYTTVETERVQRRVGLELRTFIDRDRLRVNPIRSQPPVAPPVTFHTGFRFCPCSAATGSVTSVEDCETRQLDGSGQCRIRLAPQDLRRAFVAGTPEGQLTQFFNPTLDGDPRIDALHEVNLPYSASFEIDLDARWQIETDLARWRGGGSAGFFPAAIDGPVVGDGTADIRGVVWTQALRTAPGTRNICTPTSGPAGCGAVCDATTACPSGTHCVARRCEAECSRTQACPGRGSTCGSDGTCGSELADAVLLLARHYESGAVGGSVPAASLGRMEFLGPMVFGRALCPECGANFPVAWLAGACTAPDDRPPCSWDGIQTPVLTFGDLALTEEASRTLAPTLTLLGGLPNTRWVAAAEPPASLGGDGLFYAGLSATGALPSRLLTVSDAGLGLFGKVACNKGGCFEVALTADDLSASSVPSSTDTSSDGKASRADYAIALSGQNATVWVAGGVDGAGNELHDIVAHYVDDAVSLPLSTHPLSLGRVRALAWNPLERRLYALDEVTEGHRTSTRLVSIAPDSSGAREEARWRRDESRSDGVGSSDVFVLAFDPFGHLWIGASHADSERGCGERSRHHRTDPAAHYTVGRLTRARQGWHLDGVVHGEGALHREGAYATEEGLSLAIASGPREGVAAYSEADLGRRSGAERWF